MVEEGKEKSGKWKIRRKSGRGRQRGKRKEVNSVQKSKRRGEWEEVDTI